MTKLVGSSVSLLAVCTLVAAMTGNDTARAQSQNVYTQDGWDAYPRCLDYFEEQYQQAGQNYPNIAFVCGWDGEDRVAMYVSRGTPDLEFLTARILQNCSREWPSCVVFAQNGQLSEWALARQAGWLTFRQMGRR